ncbi:MAG: flagellar motor switch protein FliM [Acidobacteriaceae bacterium]|nr:flagellar motor switch protein FliM [Acidobacteriaceae bacterium]
MNAAESGENQNKPQSIRACNFRYAGRLSNENARTLTALHEKFALQVTNSLEVYLGASLQLKLVSLEQKPIQDYIAEVATSSYVLPCALNMMESNFLMEMDAMLIYPIIDLLLGGTGTVAAEARELTEIDEQIMESVAALVIKEAERSWRSLELTLTPGRCIKAAAIPHVFPANEKLVLLLFQMEVGGVTGDFKLVLPTSFVGFLLRHLKAAQSKKVSNARAPATPNLRERLLNCKFRVSADMPQMRALVKDLAGLKPGIILRIKSPVMNAGRLTVEGVDIFEAIPVRSGKMKAAQLTTPSHEAAVVKE